MVPQTCAEAGMKAVCSGDESCGYTDITKCLVTPLSTKCQSAMSVTRDEDILLTITLPLQVPAVNEDL